MRYDLSHRPDWAAIPLRGIAELLGGLADRGELPVTDTPPGPRSTSCYRHAVGPGGRAGLLGRVGVLERARSRDRRWPCWARWVPPSTRPARGRPRPGWPTPSVRSATTSTSRRWSPLAPVVTVVDQGHRPGRGGAGVGPGRRRAGPGSSLRLEDGTDRDRRASTWTPAHWWARGASTVGTGSAGPWSCPAEPLPGGLPRAGGGAGGRPAPGHRAGGARPRRTSPPTPSGCGGPSPRSTRCAPSRAGARTCSTSIAWAPGSTATAARWWARCRCWPRSARPPQPLHPGVTPVLERGLPGRRRPARAGRVAVGPGLAGRPGTRQRRAELRAGSPAADLRPPVGQLVDRVLDELAPAFFAPGGSRPIRRSPTGSTSTRWWWTTPGSGPWPSATGTPGGRPGPTPLRRGTVEAGRLRRAPWRPATSTPSGRWTASSPRCRAGWPSGASTSTWTCRWGARPKGFDTWIDRPAYAWGAAVGAPPDDFFAAGQNWGFPPLRPAVARAEGHRLLAECLRHHMAHAGMLRLDHVMGLHRLFWVPDGHGGHRRHLRALPHRRAVRGGGHRVVSRRLPGGGRGPGHGARRGARGHGPPPGAAQLRGRVRPAPRTRRGPGPAPTGAWWPPSTPTTPRPSPPSWPIRTERRQVESGAWVAAGWSERPDLDQPTQISRS